MALHDRKDFSRLLGMPGLSDALLQQHFDIYAGHVGSLDALLDELACSPVNGSPSPDWCGLKRRVGWEWNGMRLHELYFENLTRTPARPEKSSPLGSRLATEFGSFAGWAKDFRATGLLRGVGWAALVWDPAGDRLHNIWIDENDGGHLAGCAVILLLDAFEHAFAPDYGSRRTPYVDAFLAAVDWPVAESRFAMASAGLLAPATA